MDIEIEETVDDAITVPHPVLERDSHFRFDVVHRLVSDIQQVLMVDLVVVLLRFVAWVLQVMDLHIQPQSAGNSLCLQRQIRAPVSFLKLIENPILTRRERVLQGECEALHGIAQMHESADLVTLSERRKGVANSRLAAVPIHNGAKSLIKVHWGRQMLHTLRTRISMRPSGFTGFNHELPQRLPC